MDQFEIQFWQPSPNGAEQQYYTITLHGARVESIDQMMMHNKQQDLVSIPFEEVVTFTFDSYEVVWVNGGIVGP
jgi:type VI secretion system Hcp family effector